jgi:hypothetical protein
MMSKWAALLPASTLQPLLMRYSSTDDPDLTGAGGIAPQQHWPRSLPILARQRSLQRAVSEAPEDSTSAAAVATGGGDGLQAEYTALAEEELADADVDAELGESLRCACLSSPSSACHNHFCGPAPRRLAGPRELTVRAIKDYIKFGFGAPPPLLQRLFLWRIARAASRAFGLSALHAIVSACSDAWQPLVLEALLPLRPALRGVSERQLREKARIGKQVRRV